MTCCCITNYPQLSGFRTFEFLWIRNLARLSEESLPQSFPQSCHQGVGSASKLFVCRIQFLTGCAEGPSSVLAAGLSIGVFTWQLASLEQERHRQELQPFCNPISEEKCSHVSLHLIVRTVTNPAHIQGKGTTQVCEYQEVGTTGVLLQVFSYS